MQPSQNVNINTQDAQWQPSLQHLLISLAAEGACPQLSGIVAAIARASAQLSQTIHQAAFRDHLFQNTDETNQDGDVQKGLDIHADEIYLGALRRQPAVGIYASEEQDSPILLNHGGQYAVLIDPLDGSSNINTNVSIGTIFSILPLAPDYGEDPLQAIMQKGRNQLAAGFVIFGPQTALVLAINGKTMVFYASKGEYFLVHDDLHITSNTQEFAINLSNYRHWEAGVRAYIDDCLDGSAGVREKQFNMRWIASLVADSFRILMRGGVFLYPADKRKNYDKGRLRLLYECNPVALVVENAGGRAIWGASGNEVGEILDIQPQSLHERTPFIFGSAQEVNYIASYFMDSDDKYVGEPLFKQRGLFVE